MDRDTKESIAREIVRLMANRDVLLQDAKSVLRAVEWIIDDAWRRITERPYMLRDYYDPHEQGRQQCGVDDPDLQA